MAMPTDIPPIPPGRIFGIRAPHHFCFIRREGTAYHVLCGWGVPAADGDDYESYTIHPFKPEQPQAWVGREYRTDDAVEAGQVYAAFKVAVQARQMPPHGTLTGSVVREETTTPSCQPEVPFPEPRKAT